MRLALRCEAFGQGCSGAGIAKLRTTGLCCGQGFLRPPAGTIDLRETTSRDVQIEILFCGVCHSDLHQARNEWRDFMPTLYPCVPGHEIVGRITKVGS
ncbi:MAG: alcohol dehydrogenase catalytic domain-containing protein [Bryobacteraceae bacterium]|nr:alcohol dehydrogenase catalytic domain-containing protein [Bryobacteraceae bacterium]